MTDAGEPDRVWRVRYDGVCSKYRTRLLRGMPAVSDRTGWPMGSFGRVQRRPVDEVIHIDRW
jgi:hypothetical protein